MTTTTHAPLSSAVSPSTGILSGSAADAAPPNIEMTVNRSGSAAHLTVDLGFNVGMDKGAGTIWITDGAVQTVIDRATSQPAMRIVGGTDTHQVPAASLSIDPANPTHVSFTVDGLLPDHVYSVVMTPGALLDTNGRPFAGVRDVGAHQFTAPGGDTQAPAVVSANLSGSSLHAGGKLDVTIKFSEKVATLDPSALIAENATISDLGTSDGGITWHAVLHAPAAPTSTMGNQLRIDLAKVHDDAGNAGKTVEALLAYAVDTILPSASVSLDTAQLSTSHTIDATIVFDAAVSGLTAASFNAPHATVSNLATSDGGITWHATLTGDAATLATDSASYLSLDMSTVRDAAGNAGSGAVVSQTGYYVDTKAPQAVSATLDRGTLGPGASMELTLTFSEAVTELDAAAIGAPHAKVSSLLHVSANTWRVTLLGVDATPSTGNKVTVDMSKVKDGFGNSGSGTIESASSYDIDGGAPAVTMMSLDGTHLHGNETILFGIRFSESVPRLDASAFVTPNASVSNLHTFDNVTWFGTLTGVPGTASGGGKIGIDMSKVFDAAGNAGSGTAQSEGAYVVDTAAPSLLGSIALDGSMLGMEDVIIGTMRFSEAAYLMEGAVSAPNTRVLGVFPVDETLKVWQVALYPESSGVDAPTNVITLDLGKVLDQFGNKGAGAATSGNYAVDTRLDIDFHDTGWSEADNITSAGEQQLGGVFLDRGMLGLKVKLEIDGVLRPDAEVEISHSDAPGYAYWNANVDFSEGTHTVKIWLVDPNGTASAVSSKTITVDTLAPGIVAPPGTGLVQDIAKPLEISFSEAIYWDGYEDGDPFATATLWNLDDPAAPSTQVYIDDRNLSNGRTRLTLGADDMHLVSGAHYKLVLNGKLADLAGNWLGENEIDFTASGAYSDTTVPTALRAEAGSYSGVWGGAYKAGAVIDITIRFSEPVRVLEGAHPTLKLDSGGTATYSGASSDGRELQFRYVVGPSDADTPRLAIADSSGIVGVIADLAGNKLDAAHINYTQLDPSAHGYGDDIIAIDTHAPGALGGVTLDPDSDRGDSSSDRITNDAAPTLTGTGAEPDAYEIRIYDGNSIVGYGYAEDDGSWWATASYDLPDGVHHFTVSQIDRAGNESPMSAALDVTIDRVGPAAPPAPLLAASSDTGTPGDGITADTTPTFSGSGAEPGRIVRLYADEREVGHGVSNAQGAWSITVDEPLLDQTYSFAVKQFDIAGNKSGYSDSLTVTIESGPPAAPTLALASGSDTGMPGDGITKTTNVSIEGSGEAGASLELMEGTKVLYTTTVNASGYWSILPALAEDEHVLTARQTDGAGNASVLADAIRVVVDTGAAVLAAPLLSTLSDSGLFENDGVTKVAKPVLSGSGAEAGALIQVFDGAILLGETTASAAGAWSFTPATALAEGSHALSVTQTDIAGNTSAVSLARAVTIDTAAGAAPNAPKLARTSDAGSLDNDGITNVTRPTLSGDGAEANARIEIVDGGALLGKTVADANGAWSFVPETALTPGLHSLSVRQLDLAGNTSVQSALLNLRIDTAAPSVLAAPTLDPHNPTNVKSLLLHGLGAEANASVEVYDGATLLGKTIADGSGVWSYRTADLADAVYHLHAVQIDLAGNRGTASQDLDVTIDSKMVASFGGMAGAAAHVVGIVGSAEAQFGF